jgi:hypothetical protein
MQLLCKKAIEQVPNSSTGFRSQLFTIQKKTCDHRPVLNLQLLNQFIPHRHFKMESLKTACTLINQEDYFTSIDLADAFLHVLVHHSSRRYLQFTWDSQLFQFRVLQSVCLSFTSHFQQNSSTSSSLGKTERQTPVAYLDDLLIVAKDYPTSQRDTRMILNKLAELGFFIKEAKSTRIMLRNIRA